MGGNFSYDDKELKRLFEALEPKQRIAAFKGAFRREATRVKKAATANLRAKMASTRELEKGIRGVVFKRVAGFKVTIAPKAARRGRGKERGMYASRRGKGVPKPVLLFAESGTQERYKRIKGGRLSRNVRRVLGKKGTRTGRMPRLAFMEETLDQMKGGVTESLKEQITNNVIRTAKRYGCK